MRKLIPAVFIPLLFLLCTCGKVEKDVNNFYPKVKTISAEVLPDGTVKVTGEVIKEGNTSIAYAGFCMDSIPDPGMLSNQQSVTALYDGRFSVIYEGLNVRTKYYFRAWVANSMGYHIGGDVYIDSITVSNNFIPCTPPLDSLISTTGSGAEKKERYISISPIEQLTLEYRISLSTNNHDFEINFGKKPVRGTYKTVGSNSANGQGVFMLVDNIVIEAGYEIYVHELDQQSIEVTICDLVYDSFIDGKMKTRFRASY